MRSVTRSYSLLFVLATFPLIFSSCVTRKHITYFQDLDASKVDTVHVNRKTDDGMSKLRSGVYEAKIMPGDILGIQVSSVNPEATAMFSFYGSARLSGSSDPNLASQSAGYLVDAQGSIQFPILGNVSVIGKTTIEIRSQIQELLAKYLENPIVSVRFLNFKIMLMGDVLKPGIYTFPSERVTLFEAITAAGDLTIFGNRKNIQLIRELNGKNQVIRIDLTDKNVLSTKFMYLMPNDIIYIEPGNGKIASADNLYRILPLLVTGLNIIALLIYRFK